MKLGLSYSYCLVDIYEQRVSYDDVYLIISSTHLDPYNDQQFEEIWFGYTRRGRVWDIYGETYKQKFRDLSILLHEDGKLYQPRVNNVPRPRYQPDYYQGVGLKTNWLEVLRIPGAGDNDSVVQAWDHYLTLSGLTGFETGVDHGITE